VEYRHGKRVQKARGQAVKVIYWKLFGQRIGSTIFSLFSASTPEDGEEKDRKKEINAEIHQLGLQMIRLLQSKELGPSPRKGEYRYQTDGYESNEGGSSSDGDEDSNGDEDSSLEIKSEIVSINADSDDDGAPTRRWIVYQQETDMTSPMKRFTLNERDPLEISEDEDL
jgi:hypothetical protein